MSALTRGRTRNKEHCACDDCGFFTAPKNLDGTSAGPWEWYVVHDEVWASANSVRPVGVLCIGCLEKRLGRIVGPVDFADLPVNALDDPRYFLKAFDYRTARLRSRLAGTKP